MNERPSSQTPPVLHELQVVYSRFLRSESYSPEIFTGFSSLRVLTYSASISMIIRMLNQFDSVECIFGFEGVIPQLSTVLAYQQFVCEQLATVIKGLEDEREKVILEQMQRGKVRFRVVKGTIAHAKIYLLESAEHRRVIIGSANFTQRAFSGIQNETINIFDDDDQAWEHFLGHYEALRKHSTNEIPPQTITSEYIALENLPLIEEVQQSKNGVVLFVNTDIASFTTPTALRTVERISEVYNLPVQSVIKPQRGQLQVTREVVGKIVERMKNQKRTEQRQMMPDWLSINRETSTVLLNNKELSLSPSMAEIQVDVQCLLEYFENFRMGFHGDITQHQHDYFLFLCWLYFAPFLCDLRNQAINEMEYIFDYPLFAILYGKSNSGKTKLIQTLMRSMFGYYKFIDKPLFTQSHLRGLLYTYKRFPIVFDDIDRTRFMGHAPEIIKDEGFQYPEYPAFVIAMNADEHSFSTEIVKRCLILYTKASLPGHTEQARELDRRIQSIQKRISTAFYQEYLRRMLEYLEKDPFPRDPLACSSKVIISILTDASISPLPGWCAPVRITEYQRRKYEKNRSELRKLYETHPSIWKIQRDEVILTVQPTEFHSLRKDIPDWLVREGSKAGHIVLDKRDLEEFLNMPLHHYWWQKFIGRRYK